MKTKNQLYQIKFEGHIHLDWSIWFTEYETRLEDNLTLLQGNLPDQTALHGVLMKIRDLGINLIEVKRTGK